MQTALGFKKKLPGIMLGNLLKSPRLTSFLLPGILDKFERKKRPAKGWTCFIQSADAFKLGTV